MNYGKKISRDEIKTKLCTFIQKYATKKDLIHLYNLIFQEQVKPLTMKNIQQEKKNDR